MKNIGTISVGIKMPIIKEGDDLIPIILQSIEDSEIQLDDNDILGVTESLVARSQGNYVTSKEIQDSFKSIIQGDKIVLYEPIASRNRFSFILENIAQVYKNIYIVWQSKYDEVGNIVNSKHPFTGINYTDFYISIAKKYNSSLRIIKDLSIVFSDYMDISIDCRCHPLHSPFKYTLKDICSDKCEYGLLGSNLAGNDRLKLFPRDAQQFCRELHNTILSKYNKAVYTLVYGDGCFKDPVGGIWEFADPITCPGTMIDWNKTPCEEKIKFLIDTGQDVNKVLSEKKFSSDYNKTFHQELGTTPRRINDLVASLMDLTSGSGDKGTPVVLVKNYFNHYGD